MTDHKTDLPDPATYISQNVTLEYTFSAHGCHESKLAMPDELSKCCIPSLEGTMYRCLVDAFYKLPRGLSMDLRHSTIGEQHSSSHLAPIRAHLHI